MKTVIITGGTDGLGKGLARHYLHQGAHVIAIGSTAEKGQALIAEAKALTTGRAGFVRAGLTSVAGSWELVERLANQPFRAEPRPPRPAAGRPPFRSS
ncbi:SDR family NAD(P)-dependent oxidoreductase [Nonomuraea zeae]|uniref:SDR family oxidoreductase n=1 Tax=Nonomuraea zeae TaxID=1642303 RepID=A0A5S4GZR5_9ACTN|nr:SDR family NAD(P)-dependent oxidoreductase [Nonomuraea zeae]TMR38021.1 SDR family oxidoreductase [Nonomuraea zeae]